MNQLTLSEIEKFKDKYNIICKILQEVVEKIYKIKHMMLLCDYIYICNITDFVIDINIMYDGEVEGIMILPIDVLIDHEKYLNEYASQYKKEQTEYLRKQDELEYKQYLKLKEKFENKEN